MDKEPTVKELITGLLEVVHNSDQRVGYCCCGIGEDNHDSFEQGHSYVDMGTYAAQPWIDAAKKWLKENE